MDAVPDTARPAISEWIWQKNRQGEVPTIHLPDIAALKALPRLRFDERARRLLIYLNERTEMLGKRVDIGAPEVGAMLQAFDLAEIGYVAGFLEERGWVDFEPGNGVCRLTGGGIIQAEEWARAHAASTQGFVAMWFVSALEPAWAEGFEPAIKGAGYAPRRIDKKEHVNKICDEIIAEIRRSRFVVADFSGQRGGVYFEAGYAKGRELDVIWTCREEDLKELHFDVRQYNCIDWNSPADLAARLQARISAVVGDGPLKQNR